MGIIFSKKSKTRENSFVVKVVIIAVIFGFTAGVVGQMVSHVYIDPYLEPNDYSANVNQNTSTIPELRKVRSFSGSQQDLVVEDINKKVNLSLVGLYQIKKESQDLVNNIYFEDELLANAFILTSDGWLVTQSANIDIYALNQVVAVINNRIYQIVKKVSDTLTNVVFLKIEAENLPVVVLGDWQESSLGQTVLILNSTSRSVITNIESLKYDDITSHVGIRSTEKYYYYILLKDELSKSFNSAVMLNLGGEVVGLVNDDLKTVIPVNYFFSTINSVLKNNEILRPALGISYIDLSDVDISGQNKGALVYQEPSRTSPAYQAGLKKDDIIIKVDDVVVDERSNLTQLIQDYRVGDEVELAVLRQGQQRIIEVFLGQVE